MPEPIAKKKAQENPVQTSTKKVFDANQVPEPIDLAGTGPGCLPPQQDFEKTEMSMNDPLIDAKQPISAVDFQLAQKELLDTEIVEVE